MPSVGVPRYGRARETYQRGPFPNTSAREVTPFSGSTRSPIRPRSLSSRKISCSLHPLGGGYETRPERFSIRDRPGRLRYLPFVDRLLAATSAGTVLNIRKWVEQSQASVVAPPKAGPPCAVFLAGQSLLCRWTSAGFIPKGSSQRASTRASHPCPSLKSGVRPSGDASTTPPGLGPII